MNAELVREGYARAKVYPPETPHAQCFAALEQEAREGMRGVWGKQYIFLNNPDGAMDNRV